MTDKRLQQLIMGDMYKLLFDPKKQIRLRQGLRVLRKFNVTINKAVQK